jgi:hypothetical protein
VFAVTGETGGADFVGGATVFVDVDGGETDTVVFAPATCRALLLRTPWRAE